MRTLSAAVTTALTAATLRPCMLVEMDLENTGILRLSSAPYDVVDGQGNTFFGVGALGSIDKLEEGVDPQARGIKVALTGIPLTYITTLFQEQFQGREMRILFGLFDETHTIIASPVEIGTWLMDTADIVLGTTATITVSAESVFVAWDTPNHLRYTHNEQQALYPGDVGLEHTASMAGEEFTWGRI